MDWIEALNRLLAYVEANLASPMTAAQAAQASGYSSFHMQRIFSTFAGMTLGEYIRCRRLAEAGALLQKGAAVLDTALRFAYDSPESFCRAFRRFHGVLPSQAQSGAPVKTFTPLHVSLILKGGTTMQYTIETRGPLTVIGFARRFSFDTSYKEIPKFWTEFFQTGMAEKVIPQLGVCLDCKEDTRDFEYIIGQFVDGGVEIHAPLVKRELPAATWAVFTGKGPMPHAIQKLNTQIFSEWLPASTEWEMDGDVNIEVYTDGDNSSEDYEFSIMLPVKAKAKG